MLTDDLYEYFSDFIVRNDGFADKPAPDALLYLLDKHHIDPQDAVMIGDRGIDVQAGLNAGIATILFDPSAFYPNEPTTYRCDTMQAIIELVEKHINE